MKKVLLTAAAVVAMASYAFAFAPGVLVNGVSNTAHDLGGKSLGTTQKCVFCHTPHNAGQAVPLWNRGNPTITGKYISPTMSATANAAAIGNGTISAMCMSCHDGVTAMGNIGNTGLDTAAPALNNVKKIGQVASNAKATLSDLSSTHPVAFDYVAARADEISAQGGARLADIATVKLTALGANSFFGATGQQIECASCHKVHDNRIAPFLRMSNDTSQLCLACHLK